MIEDIILVTGAPRSGTTPVGQLLTMLPGAVSLYEPMGPTGDRRFNARFPIPGQPGFSQKDLDEFVCDLKKLRLKFKSQQRPGHRGIYGLLIRLIGTRSINSYRYARLNLNKRILIWKDPHAVFCTGSINAPGFKTIITVRSPYAHAASYKRLGWVSRIEDIYPRYCHAFGAIPGFDEWMERLGKTSYGAASLLWHLIYKRVLTLPETMKSNVYLFNLSKIANNEIAAYNELFTWLGYSLPNKAQHTLQERCADTSNEHIPKKHQVHDFNRSAAQANTYWQKILTDEEVSIINKFNGALWDQLISM